ncbi:MAG: O-antigen ligase family protein, partial [Pseudomonadota bacterium]
MAGDPLGVPAGGRQRVAHGLAQLGLFCLPALVLTVPINLLPYGLLLLLSTLLAPELLWRAR